jgi:lipopolysaccharide transport protein LptA
MTLLIPSMAWAVPTQISSESLSVDHRKSEAEFTEAVHLSRDGFELRCDRLVVFYKTQGGSELDHAEAYGHVVMQQGDKHGSADKAIYKQVEGILILMGHAKVEDPKGVIQGEKVMHNINTTETSVEQGRSGERVRFFIEEDDLSKTGGKSNATDQGEVAP